MFTCRDATELMTEERERALTGWSRSKYRFHMLICGHCKAYRRQLGEAVALAQEVPRDEPPAPLEESALAAFRARAASRAP